MNQYNYFRYTACILFLLTTSAVLHSQEKDSEYKVYFKNTITVFDENISTLNNNSFINENERFGDKIYRYIQFFEIPSQTQREDIEKAGIKLLEYIPQKVYVASIPYDFSVSDLKTMNIRSVVALPVKDKIDIKLLTHPYPDWIIRKDEIRVIVHYYSDLKFDIINEELEHRGIQIIETLGDSHKLIIQIKPSLIEEFASQPFVRYLDCESQPGEPESDDGRNLHRSNAIDVDYFGGYNYDGTGVSVAINDDGFVGPHIDFKGRTDQSDVINDLSGSHGDMTVGIVGAAGNLNPVMRGMAPGAFLWVRQYNSSLPNTVTLHQNEDVMVFSSSYSDGCNDGYTSITQLVDGQIYDNPSLIQVFSAGNSNFSDCGYGAGNQWGNVTGGHKMGKNVMTTANLDKYDSLASSSSRGPASDGRIKPDISAHGASHWSTSPDNNYAPGGGTSAAAPGIAGVLAQLHQAYRELNNGDFAPSALLKASVLNTAYDLGNPGPDFKFGWGKVNALKALQTVEEERYINDSITNGLNDTHNLVVPAGVQEMRVMVYWHDVEGSVSSSMALVNNLDMTITDFNSAVHLPLVLDHTPNAITLNNTAVPGTDSINNVEQIRILSPSAGNYTITIAGTSVPFGPQEYYIVYEFLYNDIVVTYPNGGEGLIPGSTERIHWDAYGNSGNFMAQYTLDGFIWSNISNSILGNARYFDVTIPDTVSLAKVRISRNGFSDESNEFFSIIHTPENIQINSICSGTNTIEVSWDSVPNATSYDVYYLGSMYMDSTGNTSLLNHSIAVPNIYEDNWISVRARGANGIVGRRAIAIKADGSSCYLDCISDDDAGVDLLISPGVVNEICTGSVVDVSVNLINIGTNVQTGFPVYYQMDNYAIVTDTFTGNLVGGTTELFVFSQSLSLSGQGAHTIKVWTELTNDGAHCNDTLVSEIQYFELLSAFPFIEDFQSGVFPPATMIINNPDGLVTWEEAIVTGSTGVQTKAAFIDNLTYNNQGSEDYISTVSFDLSNTNYGVLEFDVSYSPYSTYYSDGLRIDISTDCGLTYNQIYLKEGDSLSTSTGFTTTSWAPSSAADWRHDTIDISNYTGGIAKIRFVNINGYGNNLYIDNIGLTNTNQETYCIPTSNCTVGDEIDDFSFNTINQTGTGCSNNGYANYLAYSTTLLAGGLYTMSMNTHYSNQFVSVWIDFNNDTIFDNLTERVLFDFNLVSTNISYSTDILIPSGSNLGSHRMRVRAHWSASCNDPCIAYSYGETHDYTVIIVNPGPPVVNLGSDINICYGTNANITANISGGLPPFSYQWSTGESSASINVMPLISTNYQLTITDSNNISSSDDIYISVNPLPNVSLGPDQVIVQGFSAILDPGYGFYSYTWNTGESTQSIEVTSSGIYSVTVSDLNFCSNSDEAEVTVVLSYGPGWNYSITGSNHTILIPSSADITVDGIPIEIGDYIGVFYDSLGTEACGGYMFYSGNTNNITAWGADIGNDGFVTGEVFKWKIWKYTTEMVFDAEATYIQPPAMPNTDTYITNGLSGITSLQYTQPAPDWYFTITGSNHTILIPANADVSVEGVQIEIGDYIGVFYDSLGTLACGGYMMWTGNTGNITAWGADTGNDGFSSGESFKWKIWKASTEMEYNAIAVYFQPPIMPNTGHYVTNGLSGILSLQYSLPSPGWTFFNSGSNHSILIPISVSIQINGNPAEPGDYVGVFYDSLGTLACAGYQMITGVTLAVTAWGADAGNDGFAPNEVFNWMVWDASEDTVFMVYAEYNQTFPNQEFYVTNGMSSLSSLSSVPPYETQEIFLTQGWGIYSTYIIPQFPNVDSLFTDIIQYTIICKDADGHIYWPQYNLNLIGEIQIGEGYLIKMLSAQTLTITGTLIIPENNGIYLGAGWDMIAYLRKTPAQITDILYPIINSVILVKNGDGNLFWPQYMVNQIGNMYPGSGYQIKMISAEILFYPPNTTSLLFQVN